MKSIVTDGPAPGEKPFPKLMISSQNNTIVLMVNQGSGSVVGNAIKLQPLSFYSESWMMQNFTDYTGTVTLSND